MLKTYLHIELHPRQQYLLRSQQYGTTAHAADISMQVFRTIFPDRLFLFSGTLPGLPASLTVQYQTTSSVATLQAKYTKRVLPIFLA